MSLLLTPYLLASAITSNESSECKEALQLLIQRPEKNALDSFRKKTGNVQKLAVLSLQFKEMFEAAREIQQTIDFYKSESSSLYVRAWQASSNLVAHWYLRHFGRLPPLNHLLKAPYSKELKELKRRKSLISEQLGHLFESFSGKVDSTIVLEDFKSEEADQICISKDFYSHLKPSFWQRHKRSLVLYGVSLYAAVFAFRYADLKSFIENLKETSASLKNFWETWIWSPLKEIYETVRFSKRDFTIVSPEALQADRDSLDRMITDYASAYKLQPETVEAMVNTGDYSFLIKEYEDQLRKPIRGALFVQKGKVDLEGALLILEKIVHANELNFGLIALVPIVTLLYTVYAACKRKWKTVIGYGHEQNKAKVQHLIWRLDRFLCKGVLDTKSMGKSLIIMDQILVTIERDEEFDGRVLKDLISLADPQLTVEQRHWTLQRLEKGIK